MREQRGAWRRKGDAWRVRQHWVESKDVTVCRDVGVVSGDGEVWDVTVRSKMYEM